MVENIAQINKSRLGGLRRVELYGNPGTYDGRSKGGKRTTTLFHQNPYLARKVGFMIRKEIKYPERSSKLAEFIGIMLGDGGFPGTHQITISFNNKTDCKYAEYICKLLNELFSINFHIHKRRGSNGADIVVSSSNLIDFLLKQGLVTGNKVKNQVDIPDWICGRSEYQKACLRGLIDTDGSFYCHRYNSSGKNYKYLKLCFANRSKPLLNSVLRILREFNFEAYLHGDQVFIYSILGIKKYFEEIGSHNPKHSNKITKFFAN